MKDCYKTTTLPDGKHQKCPIYKINWSFINYSNNVCNFTLQTRDSSTLKTLPDKSSSSLIKSSVKSGGSLLEKKSLRAVATALTGISKPFISTLWSVDSYNFQAYFKKKKSSILGAYNKP